MCCKVLQPAALHDVISHWMLHPCFRRGSASGHCVRFLEGVWRRAGIAAHQMSATEAPNAPPFFFFPLAPLPVAACAVNMVKS